MLRLPLLLLTLTIGIFSFGQNGSIKGVIKDSASIKGLPFATAAIYLAKDSSLVTYQISNKIGEFYFSKLAQKQELRLVVSFIGYKTATLAVQFDVQNTGKINFGDIILVRDTQYLENVTVRWERPPVLVKNGMIEYNASAFKTLPDALVEDLLNKMPGIEIDKNGTITANGKKVNRITIDGKYYFNDDIKIATRNLPANIIDNVQIKLDQEELDKNPDAGIGNIGSVINLNLKKGVKKNWMGRGYLGVGTANRYELGGVANLFKDTIQVNILGFSNNINKSGFTVRDLQELTGVGRNLYSYINDGIEPNPLQQTSLQYFAQDKGVSTFYGSGINFNFSPNKNSAFNIQYFYGHKKSRVDNLSSSNQFINDTTIGTETKSNKIAKANNHNISIGKIIKTKNLIDIYVKLNYSYSYARDSINSIFNTVNNKMGKSNFGAGNQFNNLSFSDLSQTLSINKRFASKDKRKFSVTESFAYKKGDQNFISEFLTHYLYPSQNIVDFAQLRNQVSPSLGFSLLASYVEPITKIFFVRLISKYDYFQDEQQIQTFEKSAQGIYDLLNSNLSNELNRKHTKFSNTLSIIYETKKVNVGIGANLYYQQLRYKYAKGTTLNQRMNKIFPSIRVNWGQNTIGYSVDVVSPTAYHLTPIVDSTSQFLIRLGNPELTPAILHKASYNLNKFNAKKWIYYNIFLSSIFTENDIIYSRTITQQGVQILKPINSNGSYLIFSGISAGKDFKQNMKFTYSVKFKGNFSFDKRNLQINNILESQKQTGFSSGCSVGINFRNKIEVKADYQISLISTKYSTEMFKNSEIIDHTIEGNLTLQVTKLLFVESSLSYKRYNLTTLNSKLLLNTYFSCLLFKQKGILKLTIFDILNKNRSILTFNSQNYFTQLEDNVLYRFAMLTFIYNLKVKKN